MKKRRRILLWILLPLLAILLVGPFLIPVPPLEGTLPPRQLADADSLFLEIQGVEVHYKVAGQGQPVFLLLHGFAASLFSWRQIIGPLAETGTVIAFDRPAFGLTERPLPGAWSGQNPYSPAAQVDLLFGLMDALGVEQAILVGNSAGGTLALLAALEAPERVQALVLVDAAVYAGGGAPAFVRPLLGLPQMDHLGPLIARRISVWGEDFARSAWHDPQKITPEIWEGYLKPLQTENWDRALWELTKASQSSNLPQQLGAIRMPTLVITGDDDRIVPTEQSIRLAGELPGAELIVIPDCGHVPHEECPQEFLAALTGFISQR